MSDSPHPYRGLDVAMGTRHGKADLVADPLGAVLNLRVHEVPVDTDSLGTFTGERPRTLSPVQAARTKAEAALGTSGTRLGLGSEGTFGPDPQLPWIPVNIEDLVLVDCEFQIHVAVRVRDPHPVYESAVVAPGEPLSDLLHRAGFPAHRLIVRPADLPVIDAGDTLVKGVSTVDTLVDAIERASRRSPRGCAIVESDLRAHCNPTRQRVIMRAAKALATRLSRLCPECAAPGWGTVHLLSGLPCAACGSTETTAPRARLLACVRCDESREEPVVETTADPSRCLICNP